MENVTQAFLLNYQVLCAGSLVKVRLVKFVCFSVEISVQRYMYLKKKHALRTWAAHSNGNKYKNHKHWIV